MFWSRWRPGWREAAARAAPAGGSRSCHRAAGGSVPVDLGICQATLPWRGPVLVQGTPSWVGADASAHSPPPHPPGISPASWQHQRAMKVLAASTHCGPSDQETGPTQVPLRQTDAGRAGGGHTSAQEQASEVSIPNQIMTAQAPPSHPRDRGWEGTGSKSSPPLPQLPPRPPC